VDRNVEPCIPGKSLAMVGVGPESADGMIRAGRKEENLEVVLVGRGETGCRVRSVVYRTYCRN
jgi:hypothetical protein